MTKVLLRHEISFAITNNPKAKIDPYGFHFYTMKQRFANIERERAIKLEIISYAKARHCNEYPGSEFDVLIFDNDEPSKPTKPKKAVSWAALIVYIELPGRQNRWIMLRKAQFESWHSDPDEQALIALYNELRGNLSSEKPKGCLKSVRGISSGDTGLKTMI
ncbi:hypothetical protein DM02DRAFT_625530 [Periconia macrospinosa]|uniref:Uncharacterized protein n=1 Tax=Periconia macrospinosa TaxID=97972 RepID=A0A2V1DZU5_9PLEO|nr:hypothetical protein DM02DRAFT_625530 [Periconia macrospinosa]